VPSIVRLGGALAVSARKLWRSLSMVDRRTLRCAVNPKERTESCGHGWFAARGPSWQTRGIFPAAARVDGGTGFGL